MKIIFLEIDGVLNCSNTKTACGAYVGIDDSRLKLLKKIVEQTGAKIVLVSTWKNAWQKDPFKKNLQDGLANYLERKFKKYGLFVSDKTSNRSGEKFLGRGEGIYSYLLDKKAIESFVILDDCIFDYATFSLTDNFVKTDFQEGGLNERHVNRAITILNKVG